MNIYSGLVGAMPERVGGAPSAGAFIAGFGIGPGEEDGKGRTHALYAFHFQLALVARQDGLADA